MGRLSNHEGIVPVYSSGVTGYGEPFLVMPYYPNGSLQDQVDMGPLDWQSAVGYIDVVAETMAAAHEAGVVHLDIKPANILLTNTGAPRIADFGIAKVSSSAAASARTTGTAFTPAYSAPETFLDGKASPAADVYGLGASLWAMLVGHPPFLGPGDDGNLMAVIGRVVNNPLGDVRHLAPEPICRVISKAMAKDPVDRFHNARDFSVALKGAMAQSGLNGAGAYTTASAVAGQNDAAAFHQFPPPVPYGNRPGTAAGDGTQVFAYQSPVPPGPTVSSARTIERGPESVAGRTGGYDRPLLPATADPSHYSGGPPPIVERTPLIDFDQFRFGPLVVGLVSLLGVGLLTAWALTRDGGGTTEPDSGVASVNESAPAGPEIDDTPTASTIDLSSTTATTGRLTSSTTATTTASTTGQTTATSSATTASTTASTSSSTTETTTSTSSSSTSSSSTSSSLPGPIQPPENVSARAVRGDVELTWSAPASGPSPTSYIVYRDGEILDEVTSSPYVDTTVSPGTYRYRVASLGANATESDLSLPASVDVPAPVNLDDLAISQVAPFNQRSISIEITSDPCIDTARISWRVEASSDTPTVQQLDPTGCVDAISHTIPNLRPNTAYRVNVTATGADGGVGSATAVFSTSNG